jgi:hypothetical protein
MSMEASLILSLPQVNNKMRQQGGIVGVIFYSTLNIGLVKCISPTFDFSKEYNSE